MIRVYNSMFSKAVSIAISTLLMSGCAGFTPAPMDSLVSIKIELPHAEGKPEGKNEDYYDPNRTGVALYDTNGGSNNRLGPYFRVREFSHTGDVVFRYARIDGKLVSCLSDLRTTIQRPISIQSAYRSWAYNTQLFREGQRAAKKSYHMSGKAADIWIGKMLPSEFARTVYSTCGCGIGLGIGDSWFHIDTRGSPVRPWGYGAGSKSRLYGVRLVQKQMCGHGGNDFNELSAALIDSTRQVIDSVSQSLKEILE